MSVWAPGREQRHAFHGLKRMVVGAVGVLTVGRRARARALTKALSTLPAPEQAIDYGCGSGLNSFVIARAFPRAEVLGVDIDEGAIRIAQRCAEASGILNVRFRVVDPDRGVGELSPADLVVCVDVLEHVHDDDTLLRGLIDLIPAGGSAVLHVPLAGQRYFIPAVGRAQQEELARGLGPHLREGYRPEALASRLIDRFNKVTHLMTIRGPAALAADLEAWTSVSRSRVAKVLLVPMLLLLSNLDVGSRAKGFLLIATGKRP
jgi:SAM-dependent methyltransferase